MVPERVLLERLADHVADGAYVVGRIVVTTHALYFDSLIPNARRAFAVPLGQITAVRSSTASGFTTSAIEIAGHEGQWRFLVDDVERWVRELEAILAVHGRPSVYR